MPSLHVRPYFTGTHARNNRLVDTEDPRKVNLTPAYRSKPADLHNLVAGKFRPPLALAFGPHRWMVGQPTIVAYCVITSPPPLPIGRVCRRVANVQMGGVNAGWDITTVEHLAGERGEPARYHPCDPVSREHTPSHTELAVPIPISVGRPFEASGGMVAPSLTEEPHDVVLCKNRDSHGEPPIKVPAVRSGRVVDATRRADFVTAILAEAGGLDFA